MDLLQQARQFEATHEGRGNLDTADLLSNLADEIERLRGKLDEAEAVRWEKEGEADRLRAIVDKLLKTADGVPVVPGMELWSKPYFEDGEWHGPFRRFGLVSDRVVWMANPMGTTYGHGGIDLHNSYSTREAAEAAKEASDA